jgi:hypothetical protein
MVKPALAVLLSLACGAQGAVAFGPGAPTSTFPAAVSFAGSGPGLSPGAQALDVSATARGLSPSANAVSGTALSTTPPADVLAAMAPRPAPPEHPANARWEDFTAVTLLSAPFTAFWSVLGAVVVATVSQSRSQGKLVAPNMGTPELSGAAMVAATASLGIGIVSVQWGGSPKRVSGTASPLPFATPTQAVP